MNKNNADFGGGVCVSCGNFTVEEWRLMSNTADLGADSSCFLVMRNTSYIDIHHFTY